MSVSYGQSGRWNALGGKGPYLDPYPPGHSRSSTISFSVVVATMNAFFSPRKVSSEFKVELEVPAAVLFPLPSCVDMEACVTLRTRSSETRAPSRCAAAANTSFPSKSGHRIRTVVSPSRGANTFRVSIRACSETSNEVFEVLLDAWPWPPLCERLDAAPGFALKNENVSARKLACAWTDFESSTATKVIPRSLTPTRTSCFFDNRSAESTCVKCRTCGSSASRAYSSCIAADGRAPRSGHPKCFLTKLGTSCFFKKIFLFPPAPHHTAPSCLPTMSGSGDSGSSLARAGVFLLGSLLGAAVAGAGVYSSLYSRKSIRSQGPSVAYVDGPHDDNRDDLPDVFPVLETRRSSLHTNSGSAQDTPPRVARHRRQSSEGLHDDRETRPRERMGRRGGHRHNSGETNRERSERRGGSTNARDSRDPADTTTDESDAEDTDARDGNPARSKSRNGSRNGSTATTRREILRDDGHDASPKPGNFDHSVKPPRPPPLSPSRPSIDQSGVPRNLPGSRATKVSGRAWTPRAHGAARGGEDQSEFTETDADNDGNDFITDVVVLSSPRPQASPGGEGASTRGLGSGSGDPETSATADAQAPSPLSRSASLDPTQRDREKVFTASLSPKRPSGETIRSGVSGEGLLANSPGGAPGADAKSASRVLAYVGLETPGSHVGRLAEKALRGVDDPSLGLAPSTTGSAEASDPRAAGDPNHSPGVDQTNGVTSATARALSDSFQETISTQPEISFSRKSSLGALAEQPVTYEYGRVLAPDDELTSECEEVCLMLEHCMALRDEYLFVSETEIDPNKGTPCVTGKIEITPNELLPKKGKHAFEMIAGVMHVYEETDDENEFSKGDSDGTASASSTKTKKLVFAPPATATQFFHDMHAVLRVHSYGPSKSFCHKRLNLTEQKFSLHVRVSGFPKSGDATFTAPGRVHYS